MLVMMEAIVPVAKENDTMPISIKNMQRAFSSTLYGVISPYPTVTRVVTVK